MGYVIVSVLSLAAGFSLAAAMLRPGPRRRRGGLLPRTAYTGSKAPGTRTPATATSAVSSSPPELGARSAVKVLRPTPPPPSSVTALSYSGADTGGNLGPRPVEHADFAKTQAEWDSWGAGHGVVFLPSWDVSGAFTTRDAPKKLRRWWWRP